MIRKYKLDSEEQALLHELENKEWKIIEPQQKELANLQASAKTHGNKLHRVNIRLTDWDYEKMQVKAMEEGIPFTTLIGSIVHQFASGRLVQCTN